MAGFALGPTCSDPHALVTESRNEIVKRLFCGRAPRFFSCVTSLYIEKPPPTSPLSTSFLLPLSHPVDALAILRSPSFRIATHLKKEQVIMEKTLESPLDCKEIQPVHPKGNQS